MAAGRIDIVGLGPGGADWLTPEANAALAEAQDLVGYGPYVARVPDHGQRRHQSDNRVELDRARHALSLAADGRRVAIVSSGDPGIFAMAAATFEAIEQGPAAWRELAVRVLPGLSAMQAAAARVGAPLGHDFCVISLSDNLKPWDLIERRLAAAAAADFVLALYNPVSLARPRQLDRAFELLRSLRAADTPVILARAVGDAEKESIRLTTLAQVGAGDADMRTVILIGSSTTKVIARDGAAPWVYTPRSHPGLS